MHELALIKDLLHRIEFIALELHSRKIAGVKVSLGALAQITAERFRERFAHAARRTVAEGARLEIEVMQDVHHPWAQHIILENVEIAD
ncbi:hydrogenase maturation nickel metallochaperone HypA [candidate division KSB1 bacterium]|nr:hydrogenase maturation nickel metallochaperone HypA [candidate division KSB1 bacterium]